MHSQEWAANHGISLISNANKANNVPYRYEDETRNILQVKN